MISLLQTVASRQVAFPKKNGPLPQRYLMGQEEPTKLRNPGYVPVVDLARDLRPGPLGAVERL